MKYLLLIAFILVEVLPALAGEVTLGTEEQRESGRKLYEKYCSQCHGDEGDGEGIARPFFKPDPRDFTSGAFKIRTTESGELPTDTDLKNIIRNGMPYTGMPAWPKLSDKELMDLVYYIKTFAEDFADPEFVIPPLAMPEPPPFSEESAGKGEEVYRKNKCIDCHGKKGYGDGESAPTLKDDWENTIRPADLTKRWTFRGGSTRKDIYRTFTTGMNGTPMPSYSDSIDPEKRWQLVDYIYSLSRDNPDYSTTLVANGIEGEIDLSEISEAKALFAGAEAAFFPVMGQIIEPGREFYPTANAVKVKAVYNHEEIALMLTWHDMKAETSGSNSPSVTVPGYSPDAEATSEEFPDAVAVQVPSRTQQGFIKPYFLFGGKKNSVDLWFTDLATQGARLFIGKGSNNIKEVQGDEGKISSISSYEDGEWTVIFKRNRTSENGLSFEEESFVPIAFSFWYGFYKERGNKRGVTSWYSLYLKPMETPSAVVPMLKSGALILFLEILLVFWARRKYNNQTKGDSL